MTNPRRNRRPSTHLAPAVRPSLASSLSTWATLFIGLALAAGCAHSRDAQTPNAFAARRQLAHELLARREWAAAFQTISELHRERDTDPDVLVMRATVYRERNLLPEAEADLRQALERAPKFAPAHAALGILLDITQRSKEAEAAHREAIKLEPKNASYLNNLGFSLYLKGNAREAIAVYLQAARLDPLNRRTRTNLGFAYAATGDLHRAAREFEMGAGTPADAKNNLGFAYERRGDLRNAYVLYGEAASLDPKSPRMRANLEHVAALLGEPVPTTEGLGGREVSGAAPASTSSEPGPAAAPATDEADPSSPPAPSSAAGSGARPLSPTAATEETRS